MHTPKLSDLAEKAERGLMVLLSGVALGFMGLFYFIALRRFTFPLSLEWAEGGILDMMRRVASHHALYAAPTIEYVPFLYTPAYFYLGAAMSRFTGVSFIPLRLLSILATSGCLVLIFAMVRRSTREWFAPWVACGLFVALYSQADAWFDLARVDMLYLFFLLLAIILAQRGFSIWSAIVFVIAFQTKQSAALVALFVLAHEIRRPRRMIAGLTTFGLGVAVSSWLINRQDQGWYRYYTAYLPSHQAWASSKFIAFWLRDLVDPLGVAFILLLLGALLYAAKPSENRQDSYFLVFTTTGMLLSSLTARLHLGGAINVTLPLYAWICILFGLSVHLILSWTKRAPVELSAVLGVATLAACLVQFVHLIYSPGQYLPTREQRAEAALVVNRVSALSGRIFVLHHVIDAGSAGKEGFAGGMEVWDVLRADKGPVGQKLKADLVHSFETKAYDGILCDRTPSTLFPEEDDYLKEVAAAAGAAYPKQERILSVPEEREFYANPVTPQIKPQFLYLPR
jgi:Glycosyltransferase family 87